ncbi:MAG: glycosyltransferase [Caldilineae bacterium]|nr:MAG: glycosyltransferase [Caldilineae bacterium]
MKRLLYVTQYYASKDQPGGSRHDQHIRALMAHGYRVTLVTSYVKNRLRVIPPQYRGVFIAREQDGDLQIYKTYAYPHYGRDFWTRMLNYFSFFFFALLAGLKAPPCDVVFASSPSLFVGLAGYLLSKLRRATFVFEVRDLWVDSAIVMGALRNPFLIWLSRRLERFLYRRARRIIAVTKGIREGIIGEGIPPEKVVLVPNGVDDDLFATLPDDRRESIRRQYGWDGRFVALYAGTLARSDGLEAIVRAAATLTHYRNLQIVFLGDGEVKPRLTAMAEETHLANVTFLPSQPKCRVPHFIAAADVCLMPVKNDPFFQLTLPNKLFDYMAGARPVIAAVPPGEAQSLVEEAQAGLVIPPEDEIRLAAALLELCEHPDACRQYGENGRRYVLRHYRRSRLAGRLIAALDEACPKRRRRRLYPFLKRWLDIIGASVGLGVLSPLLAVIALLIHFDSPGPVFFRQERAGRNGVPFRIIKFRTMRDEPAPPRGFQSGDDPRITRLGRWLRRLSLDELPQLVNVLKGEMSLVGPRPALPYQIERYNDFQRRRLSVRPGITGWAQVNGRNALTWEEKIALDVWYVDHCSLALDVRILFKTIGVVLKPSGIYFHGEGSAWHAPTREQNPHA